MPSFMCCVSAVCTFENNVEAMACGICDSPNEAAGDDDNDDGDDFGGDFGGGYGEGGDLGDDGNESCEGGLESARREVTRVDALLVADLVNGRHQRFIQGQGGLPVHRREGSCRRREPAREHGFRRRRLAQAQRPGLEQ